MSFMCFAILVVVAVAGSFIYKKVRKDNKPTGSAGGGSGSSSEEK